MKNDQLSKVVSKTILPLLSKQQYHFALQVIGHAFFLTLIALSLLFYQERMMNFDSAYYTFTVLNYGEFYTPHDRTINYVSQWLPLLGKQMGWSLRTILMGYSAIFFLFYYAIYNLIVYGFKHVEGGVFMALCMCLATRYKFYAGISEIYVALALAALLIAWLTSEKANSLTYKPQWKFAVAVPLVLLCSTSHPIIVLPILAYFGFDWFYNKRWFDGWNWGLIAFTLLVFAYRFLAIRGDSYEGRRMENALGQIQELTSYTELKVWHIMKHYFETEYTLAFVLFLVLVGVLIWRRKVWSGLLLLLCNFLLLLMVFVTYSYLKADSRLMIDGYLGLVGIVWAIPILVLVLKSKRYYLSIGLSVGLLTFGLVRTYSKHEFFSQRLEYLTYLMENNGTANEQKLLLRLQALDWTRTWHHWSMPYETLLLSSIESPENSKTIFVADWNADLEQLLSERYEMLNEECKITELPSQYFKLDTNRYVKITDTPPKE